MFFVGWLSVVPHLKCTMRAGAFQKDDFKIPFYSSSREQDIPESLKKLLEKMHGLVRTHSKSQL